MREMAMPNRSVHIVVNRGMYGLSQSRFLANALLEKRLNKRCYYQSNLVPGLWKHDWRPIQFTLVVDDFGVKYVGKEHALHLKKTIEEHYKVMAFTLRVAHISSVKLTRETRESLREKCFFSQAPAT